MIFSDAILLKFLLSLIAYKYLYSLDQIPVFIEPNSWEKDYIVNEYLTDPKIIEVVWSSSTLEYYSKFPETIGKSVMLTQCNPLGSLVDIVKYMKQIQHYQIHGKILILVVMI